MYVMLSLRNILCSKHLAESRIPLWRQQIGRWGWRWRRNFLLVYLVVNRFQYVSSTKSTHILRCVEALARVGEFDKSMLPKAISMFEVRSNCLCTHDSLREQKLVGILVVSQSRWIVHWRDLGCWGSVSVAFMTITLPHFLFSTDSEMPCKGSRTSILGSLLLFVSWQFFCRHVTLISAAFNLSRTLGKVGWSICPVFPDQSNVLVSASSVWCFFYNGNFFTTKHAVTKGDRWTGKDPENLTCYFLSAFILVLWTVLYTISVACAFKKFCLKGVVKTTKHGTLSKWTLMYDCYQTR